VQSSPRDFRTDAVDWVRGFVAPGGRLLVIPAIAEEWEDGPDGPWPPNRAEVDSFAAGDLELVRLEAPPGIDGSPRWRAEFRRARVRPRRR
jgi:hypothetical protein